MSLLSAWESMSLLRRLVWAMLAVALGAVLTLMPVLMTMESQAARDDLARELQAELSLLPSALSEIVVTGDYASLQQYLGELVHKPHLARASFVDVGGMSIEVTDNMVGNEAPAWFAPLVGFKPLSGTTLIKVGGTTYGQFQLDMNPQPMINSTWHRLCQQLAFMLITLVVLLVLLARLQQRALEPLGKLQTALESYRTSGAHTTLAESGSSEVRSLIRAYNELTASLDEAHESWRFFEVMAEKALDPAYAIDYENGGRFVWVNDAAARHFGLPIEAVLKTHMIDWDPVFTAEQLERFRVVQRTEDIPPFETVHHLGDGRQVPVEVANKLVQFKGREYGIGRFRDISERRRQADEMRAAKEAAEAGNRAKSEFLANMSHEIRTPMNGVLGMAQLMLGDELSPAHREQVEIIRSSAEALLSLINDILDLSKIEAGQLTLHQEAFDPRETMRELEALLGTEAIKKGVALQTQIDPALPAQIQGDAFRLRQILINLLGNALKFTPKGHVELTARYLANPQRPMMSWQVQDSGIGMSEETIRRLFSPFTQADGSITRRFGGTGLGLSISRRLIEMMGGEIHVKSVEGAGSTFTVTLPCHSAQPTQQQSVAEGSADLAVGLHVLLVEDNAVNQKVAKAMLGRMGCQVTVAENGRIALEILAENTFDAILMDCQMPEMDGFEATRQIRAGSAGPDAQRLPIIAMTANAMAGDREACLEAGMNDYLSKPVQADKLKAMLSQLQKHNNT